MSKHAVNLTFCGDICSNNDDAYDISCDFQDELQQISKNVNGDSKQCIDNNYDVCDIDSATDHASSTNVNETKVNKIPSNAKGITIAHLNIVTLPAKIDQVKCFMQDNHADVFAFTETRLEDHIPDNIVSIDF